MPPSPSDAVEAAFVDRAQQAEDRLDVLIFVGCGTNLRPMVWESVDDVVVGGREDEPPARVACALIARLTSMKVKLEPPLGDRVVLDAVTG